VALMVLSHAMMAAIFMVCCGLFALLAGLMKPGLAGDPVVVPDSEHEGGGSFQGVGRGALALGTGLYLRAGGSCPASPAASPRSISRPPATPWPASP
jgi:hypothetical protein